MGRGSGLNLRRYWRFTPMKSLRSKHISSLEYRPVPHPYGFSNTSFTSTYAALHFFFFFEYVLVSLGGFKVRPGLSKFDEVWVRLGPELAQVINQLVLPHRMAKVQFINWFELSCAIPTRHSLLLDFGGLHTENHSTTQRYRPKPYRGKLTN